MTNTIYIKLTDKYFYLYDDKVKRYKGKYIKNGKVDDVPKLISYLNSILPFSLYKNKYVFILDTLLCNSDLFVYKYVFENMGLFQYKIVNDVDIIRANLTDDNIFLFNWSSSCNYAIKNNDQIIINRVNPKVINNLNKKYIISVGDEDISKEINLPIFKSEYEDRVIFNYI